MTIIRKGDIVRIESAVRCAGSDIYGEDIILDIGPHGLRIPAEAATIIQHGVQPGDVVRVRSYPDGKSGVVRAVHANHAWIDWGEDDGMGTADVDVLVRISSEAERRASALSDLAELDAELIGNAE